MFTIETDYDQKSLTAMARALRRTIRKKHSRRSHIFGWVSVALGLLLFLSAEEVKFSTIITFLSVAIIVIVLIFEDRINGFVAGRRGLPGLNKSTVTFYEDHYHSVTYLGESDFYYDHILRFVETKEYFVFVFSSSHAQVYDMRRLSGGTKEDFITFISTKCGKELETV